jgi:ABC-type glycerol-3-phosphate transport system substrate-binding protein
VSAARYLAALTFVVIASPGCTREEADRGTRVVTIWAHQGQERENAAMRAIISAFNDAHRSKRIRADIHFFPDTQYADKVSIASATTRLPDVLDIDGPYVGPWAATGVLNPLDAHVDATLRSDFLPSILEQGTYEGSLYALGAFDSALVVYFNRDIVERAGVSPPERVANVWTWAEFVDALRRVKPHAAVPVSLHMDEQSDEWLTYAFTPLVWSNGGHLIDLERNAVVGVLDSPAVVEAVQKWQALFTEGLAEKTTTNPNPFAAGLAAFDWTGHWMLPGFEAADGLRFGVMPLPRMGAEPVCGSGSWCWGISRDCRDEKAAWAVVQWLVHPEHGIRPVVSANGAVPARRSAFRFFPAYEQLPRRLFREQLEAAARARPRTGAYLTLTAAFARSLRDIALGADVRETLGRAAQSVQRSLDRR